MSELQLPRRGDVVIVEQGLGVVRFVGNVDFDKGQHIGVEIKGNDIEYGNDGCLNGRRYFDTTQNMNNGLFIQMDDITRIVTSEEILAKLAILYDIVTGNVDNQHFVRYSKYNEILKENENLRQNILIQNSSAPNDDDDVDPNPEIDDTNHSHEALETIKSNSGSGSGSHATTESDVQQHNHKASNDTKHDDINDMPDMESESESIHTDDEPSPSSKTHQIVVNHITEEDDGIRDLYALSNITFQCIQSASATQSGTSKGKTKTNQDNFIMFDTFGPSSIFQLYGVCDGHGPNGHHVSQFVTHKLPIILNDLLTQSIDAKHPISITSILKETFESIDSTLIALQQEDALEFDINYSGTTATVGLFAGNKLYVANLGDSRTVLGQVPPISNKNKTVPIPRALSNDHDPTNSSEMMRIQKSKSGKILLDEDNDARIQIEIPQIIQNDNLLNHRRQSQSQVKKISASVSRSFGDKIAHEYGGLISTPEITIHTLSDDDIFVIFASDGIWQMLDNDDVMRMVGTKLNQNKNDKIWSDLQKTTNKLVREANISWQDEYEDYTDDITCVIARVARI